MQKAHIAQCSLPVALFILMLSIFIGMLQLGISLGFVANIIDRRRIMLLISRGKRKRIEKDRLQKN